MLIDLPSFLAGLIDAVVLMTVLAGTSGLVDLSVTGDVLSSVVCTAGGEGSKV